MTRPEFDAVTSKYAGLRAAVIGDFCLDRYLEIDQREKEVSIETGLDVYNVASVRAQPGGAGTIVNNLIALGIRRIFPVGFCGEDGEGFELGRALAASAGVDLRFFLQTSARRTFTYCKPLLVENGKPPVELNRLDFKNWTPTPAALQQKLADAILAAAAEVDALIVLDQVDIAGTGVVGPLVLEAIRSVAGSRPSLPILADSRASLGKFPPVIFKMNRAELAALAGKALPMKMAELESHARELARRNGCHVFVTLQEAGMIAVSPAGEVTHRPAFPVRGPINVVGAGDSVTANLTAALAAGATVGQALELAMAAASIVLHQLGTTGVARPEQLAALVA